MPRIKIIPEAKKPLKPNSGDLSRTVDRFRPPGGKPPLPMEKSYNSQGPGKH
jgi:hypothetical protein